jgi:hypothetical protein
VPSTVTLVGLHEIVIDGVVVVLLLALLPQELKVAAAAISANMKRRLPQRARSRLKSKFGSSTRTPPARTTLIFLRKIRSPSSRRTSLYTQESN